MMAPTSLTSTMMGNNGVADAITASPLLHKDEDHRIQRIMLRYAGNAAMCRPAAQWMQAIIVQQGLGLGTMTMSKTT